jgi:hypothetical protein
MPHGVFDGFVLYMRKRRAAERDRKFKEGSHAGSGTQ